jgi:hypothetical protein
VHPRLVLLLQVPASLLIVAAFPGNWAKLGALLVLWILTFRTLTKSEWILYVAACGFFTVMNALSLRQGIFAFTAPDALGMPVYEFFMWGFYLLHVKRLLDGPAPQGTPRQTGLVWTLALLYAGAFAALADPNILLTATGVLLAVGLLLFHERLDLSYAGYMVLLGAAFEYTGVLSGQWAYPDHPPGGVPLWFVTLWGGVGLFLRRLVLPLLSRESQVSLP